MTTKCVATKKDDVDREHDCADTEPEGTVASHRIVEPERFPNVVAQDQNENEREIQKIAVNILHDERERALAQISFARLADRACRRVGPERFIISATIVVAGQPESSRRPQNY